VLAVLLALTASVAWGSGDFLGGLASRRRHHAAVLMVSQACAVAVLAAVVAAGAGAWPGLGAVWPAVAAGAATGVGLLALYRSLAVGTMGVIAPLFTLSTCMPVLWGLASGDRPSALQAGGIALALGGLVLTSRAGGSGRRGTARGRGARRLPPGAPTAILAAAMIGLGLIGLDASADAEPLWTIGLARTTTLLVIAAMAARRLADVRALARRPGAVPLIGLLDTGGMACFTLATTSGLLSVVTVLATLYPAVTVLLARAVLRERLGGGQAAGVVLVLAGAALVAGG
jgi:drug/metabolite transporter (DMT)-like permease